MNSNKIEFHEHAAARFSELAQDILGKVGSFGRMQPSHPGTPLEIHLAATFAAKDIIGEIRWQESAVNGLGQETGRFWESGGHRVGWDGDNFQAIQQLASRLATSAPLKGRVSHRFVLDQVFTWLRVTLEQKRVDSLSEFIAARCSEEIKDHEIWVPVYRTYSGREFPMGNVRFRIISKEILERWYERIPEEVRQRNPAIVDKLNRERSALQGTLAVQVNVTAEPQKAAETAQAAADEAIALLRFLSTVNWTCRITSHCLPIGRENTRTSLDLVVENDRIQSISQAAVQEGPAAWNVDEDERSPVHPGLREALHQLAVDKDKSKFRTDLYGALQLHARNSVASEVAHKLVFVVAAIESFLLKDAREPIQKNLGERMAFLTGTTVDERKDVIKNVDDFYNIRSGLIHHGRDVREEDKEIVDKFFFNVWFTFYRLLAQVDHFQTRNDLFTMLENRKLS